MSNEILNSLLKEYDKKKIYAELELEKRKNELYNQFPRLKEIEDNITHYSIDMAKNILNNSATSSQLEEKISQLKKEKLKILKELNLDESYLKPNYECSICNDSGYFLDDNYKTQMCSCLKQKLLNISFNKSNIANIEKENFETFNELLFSDDVDLAKYKYNISPRQNIKNIKENCIKFVENFDNPETKNLLFVGNTGLR